MKRLLAALVGLFAVLLIACGGGGSGDEEKDILVTGQFGTVPVISFEPPLALTSSETRVVIEGEGKDVEEGAPIVLFLTAFSGDDGTLMEDSGIPRIIFATREDLGNDLYDVVAEVPEGSRLLVTQPVQLDRRREMVVTVVDVLHTLATGEPTDASLDGRMVVEEGEDGSPELTIGHEVMPSGGLEITQLARGDGEQVRAGENVVVQYTVWKWSDGEVLDTTWDDGAPALLALDEAFPGVRTGLVDQQVGSRVLLEIPPNLGTGTDTLVMVADILAASDGTDPSD